MNMPSIPITNLDLFLTAVGQWNLFDMEIRGVRYHAPRIGTGTLELDFYLQTDNLRPRAADIAATEFEFAFRFAGAEGLSIDDFAGSIVADYEFSARQVPGREPPYIDISLTSNSVGDISFLCESVTVVSVRELPVRGAA